MASSTSIQKLPVELLIKLFESLDSIAAVTNLAKTSKHFFDIWKLNAHTLCITTLPRCVPSYNLVQELATAIIRRRSLRMSQRGTTIRRATVNQSIIYKATLILNISRTGALLLDIFEADIHRQPSWFPGGYHPDWEEDSRRSSSDKLQPQPSDPDRFRNLYYRLWILAVIPRPAAKNFLVALGSCRAGRLAEFAVFWIINLSGRKPRRMELMESVWDVILDEVLCEFVRHFKDALLFHRTYGRLPVQRELAKPPKTLGAEAAWDD